MLSAAAMLLIASMQTTFYLERLPYIQVRCAHEQRRIVPTCGGWLYSTLYKPSGVDPDSLGRCMCILQVVALQ